MAESKIRYTFALGEMAEWSIAAVLKTVELRGSGGSNPSLSAKNQPVGWLVLFFDSGKGAGVVELARLESE